MDRPLYDIVVNENDETGVDFNALVDYPAHSKGYISFGKGEHVPYHFNEEAEGEERIVTGVMISADTIIYRNDNVYGEHDVRFRSDEIKKIHKKFHKNGFNNNLNEMHDPEKEIEGVTMIESYIIGGNNRAQAPEAFAEQSLKEGSWIASYYIENDEIWEKVKTGEFGGFSVEGIFKRVPAKDDMKKYTGKFKAAKGKYGVVTEVSKWDIVIDQDETTIDVGTELTQSWEDMDGEVHTDKLMDGEYMLPDGRRILVDADGITQLIFKSDEKGDKMKNDKENKEDKTKLAKLWNAVFGKDKFGEATTSDGVAIKWEGDLAEGTIVLTVNEDGEDVPAEAGDHQITIDEVVKVITLDDTGAVTSIEEVEDPGDEMSAAQFTAFMKQYDEKQTERYNELKEKHEALQKKVNKLAGEKDDKFNEDTKKVDEETKTFSEIIRGTK